MNRQDNEKMRESAKEILAALVDTEDKGERKDLAKALKGIIETYAQELESRLPVRLGEVGMTYKDTGLQQHGR